ncbi:hypothetical protein SAMN04488563_1672 [Jiangella alkaliphila]|uniref:Uncharacterized protein n=1 Tax=Jiangella alkaliphila TaxID=419479 RepID=A0A1H2IFM9_9ACTN|nr:hypothetical protein SAMN04488563_1672 [Jiangella alkaliphila]
MTIVPDFGDDEDPFTEEDGRGDDVDQALPDVDDPGEAS